MVSVLIFAVGMFLGVIIGALWVLMSLDDIEQEEFEEWEAWDYGDIYKDW